MILLDEQSVRVSADEGTNYPTYAMDDGIDDVLVLGGERECLFPEISFDLDGPVVGDMEELHLGAGPDAPRVEVHDRGGRDTWACLREVEVWGDREEPLPFG